MATPKELLFRMPAEWEKHSAIWLSWPHDPDSFPNLEKTEEIFADFIKEIHTSETVNLLVLNEEMRQKVLAHLKSRGVDIGLIIFHTADYADIWFRDYGPLFVISEQNRKLAAVKWKFNAWGGKYETLLKDNEIPYLISRNLKIDLFEPGIVMEGGSLEINGKGTVMTTEQCLLNSNRNPHLTKNEIEKYLGDYLNARHFIWLKSGIEGDDTDGHIDDIARFVNPNTILCVYSEDKQDLDYEKLKENFEILKSSKDQDGNPLNIVKLPMPGRVGEGKKIYPASYANFYIGNSKVIVPIFGTSNDKKALEIISSFFPDRQTIGINAFHLVCGLGTFHCMSQQQPKI